MNAEKKGKSVKIFMTGEAGYHNLGDEGMAEASLLRLRQYFPQSDIVATGLDPLGSVLRHQATIIPWPLLPYQLTNSYAQRVLQKAARRFGASEDFLDPVGRDFQTIFAEQMRDNEQFRTVLQMMDDADFVFDMGHGALNDIFNPFMLCFVYYLAGKLQKPLFISGQTIGPIWREQSRKMLNDTLSYAHTLGLRDRQISKNELDDNIGFHSSGTKVVEVGDDTLDLPAKSPDFSFLPSRVQQLLNNEPFFAVQWRMSNYSASVSYTKQLLPLIEAVKLLHLETGLTPLFVPLSWEVGHSDILAAARMKDYLRDEIPFPIVWNYLQADEIKWLLGQARFGVGISYHFHVFLLSQGIPSIGFYSNRYYELKLKGVFAAYDYQGEPAPYPPHADSQILQNTLPIIDGWTDQDAVRLRNRAALLSTKWHDVFTNFVTESNLDRLR